MSTPALPGIFGTVEPVLNHYGYLAVTLFVTTEDFGIPVPGETILIAASLFAGAGRLNVVLVGVVGVLAAVVGDNIGFAIGHFGGRTLALRFGKYVFLTAERLDKAEYFFEHHGGKIIVAARFIEGLRQANGIVAGISGMHWKRFVAFNALGAALWVGVWVSLGYLAGSYITTIYDQITRYSLYVLIALALAVAAFIAWRLWRRRARRRARAAGPAAASERDAAPGSSAAGHARPPEATEAPEASEVPETAGVPETTEMPEAAGAPELGALDGTPQATEPGAPEPGALDGTPQATEPGTPEPGAPDGTPQATEPGAPELGEHGGTREASEAVDAAGDRGGLHG
jgi:membrane protein DedA with SNARE-associated domain